MRNTPTPPGTSGELKPCPFCGGEAVLKNRRKYEDAMLGGTYRAKMVELFCTSATCGASLQGAKLSEKSIIKAWNTRTPERKEAPDEAGLRNVIRERIYAWLLERGLLTDGIPQNHDEYLNRSKEWNSRASEIAGVVINAIRPHLAPDTEVLDALAALEAELDMQVHNQLKREEGKLPDDYQLDVNISLGLWGKISAILEARGR